MKNADLYQLKEGLENVSHLKGLKFAIMVAKNLRIVGDELATFSEGEPVPSAEFAVYDNARLALARSFADTDDGGNPVISGNSFVMTQRRVEFEEAWKQLRDTHSDAIDKMDVVIATYQREFRELMDTDVAVELFTIPEDCLPEDIHAAQLTAILPLLEG